MRLKKKITRGLIYRLARFGQKMACLLSLSAGIKFGKFCGTIAFYVVPKERYKALESLQIAFGEEKSPDELRTIALGAYQNLGKCCIELFKLPSLQKADLDKIVRLEGREHLDEAFSRGRGVLCVTAHLGNWEMLAAYMSKSLGCKVNVVARRINNEGINESLMNLRSQSGVTTILREKGFASQRQILSALKNNELLGILMDQDTKVDGVFVDFFGHPAYTPKGPVSLSLSTGATLLPMFITREPDDTHIINILPIFELKRTENKEADMLTNTAGLTSIIEDQIRLEPRQWVWMHRRWKRKPKI